MFFKYITIYLMHHFPLMIHIEKIMHSNEYNSGFQRKFQFCHTPPVRNIFTFIITQEVHSIIKFHGKNIDYRIFVLGKNQFD